MCSHPHQPARGYQLAGRRVEFIPLWGFFVLDRVHIVAKMNKALDEVRTEETRRMQRDGNTPALKGSHFPSPTPPRLLLTIGK
ncbi:MAG TPA: hypothetical protein VKU19_29455 [Bryobacteraceae bacterium]|nr:hypothetical protein [Bryobacteraceae bacterium]